MRRLIFSILLLFIFWYIPAYAQMPFPGWGVVKAVPATGDSCTGNLLVSGHSENNDDVTTSANGTQGCAANAANNSVTKSNVTYTSTAGQFYDGSYGLSASGWAHYVVVGTTGYDLTAKGCVEMWYEHDSTPHTSFLAELYVDGTHGIQFQWNVDGTLTIKSQDGTNNLSLTSTDTTAAGGSVVKAGWDFSQAGGSDILRVKVGANAWKEATNLTGVDVGAMPAGFTLFGVSISSYGYIDGWKIWASANCE